MNKMVKLFLASVFVASTAVAGELKIDQNSGIDATAGHDLSVEFQLDLVNSAIFKVLHKEMKNGHMLTSVASSGTDTDGYIYIGRVLQVAPSAALGQTCDSTIKVDPGQTADSSAGVPAAIAFSAARLNAQGTVAVGQLDPDTSVDLSAISGVQAASCLIHVAAGKKYMDLSIPLLSLYAVSGSPMDVAVSIENDVVNSFEEVGIGALNTLSASHAGLTGADGILDQIKLRAQVVGAGAKKQYNATVYYDVSQQ